MLQNLVRQAQNKPAELEETLLALEAARQKLAQLVDEKHMIETCIALEVARDRQFSNETLRKAEVARRVKEAAQELDKKIAAAKTEIAKLEARAEKIKWELRAAQSLLQLAAAAMQSGNEEVLAMFLHNEEREEPENNGIIEVQARVLGAMPARKDGVVKAFLETDTGDQLEVFANGKNGAAKKLCEKLLESVRVKLKRLDSGRWFVLAVA